MPYRLIVAALLLSSSPALAGTVAFSGSYSNQNPPAEQSGRCAPAARTVTFGPSIAPASGSSSLGSFAPSGSHCITPPLPTSYSDGLFSFDFGSGDVLTGTYSGTLTATAVPGQFANTQDYIVTGGSGRYAQAEGSFQGVGTVTFAPEALPSSLQTLSGSITAPGIPEPATWAMLIGGFGMLGFAARARSVRYPATR